jgi:hypothetical protein
LRRRVSLKDSTVDVMVEANGTDDQVGRSVACQVAGKFSDFSPCCLGRSTISKSERLPRSKMCWLDVYSGNIPVIPIGKSLRATRSTTLDCSQCANLAQDAATLGLLLC